ncbi:MAG: SLC45 family MFS transporter [Tidjanibacter sp.]|nr:SLC45 family MFS transporter [Tidjanibacter sp.]
MTNQKRNLTFWQMWNLSFGFFGVQIAYALQSANISRIFATLGADPHTLSFFWVLPPLMGMIVQPIVGSLSDKTWCRLGRRKPYLYIGSIIAVIVMALLPNSGSFNLTVKAALAFGAVMLMLLDTSINMAMQPFKMMVGDMVNEEQKTKAFSIQSLLCNAGSLVGYLFPYVFTWIGVSNVAPEGMIPASVTWSFYVGAIILILCVAFTGAKVKEMNPEEYAAFHGIKPEEKEEKKESTNLLHLLVKAPAAFWQIGLVQFFCWFAFLYMWNNTTGAIAENVWGTVDAKSAAFQAAGDWTGVLFAVQSIGSILWAIVLPRFRNNKVGYSVSLLLGAAGFISTWFIHDQYMLFVSFLLIGCAWAAMLAMPFAMLTNAISGSKSMGSYLGLFNCTICLPQIVAALVGGFLFKTFGGEKIALESGALVQSGQGVMLVIAGISLLIAAVAVFGIKTKKATK